MLMRTPLLGRSTIPSREDVGVRLEVCVLNK
jgi:hypothetical protein